MPYYKYPNTYTAAVLAKRIQQRAILRDDLRCLRGRQRISSIVCKKCIIHDVAKDLFHDGVFYTYDPKTLLARLGDGSHMTPVGLEMMRSSYKKILDKLLSVLPN
ncbi:hypothetical protein OSTOST_17089, partial [Ostertagia ostertagi]